MASAGSLASTREKRDVRPPAHHSDPRLKPRIGRQYQVSEVPDYLGAYDEDVVGRLLDETGDLAHPDLDPQPSKAIASELARSTSTRLTEAAFEAAPQEEVVAYEQDILESGFCVSVHFAHGKRQSAVDDGHGNWRSGIVMRSYLSIAPGHETVYDIMMADGREERGGAGLEG